MSIRTFVVTIGIAVGLFFSTAALAGECKVVVTEEGEPVVGAMVDGVSADGMVVGPVNTDDAGNATLNGQATEYKIRVQGMDAGTCTGFLMVDLGALKAEHMPPGGTDGPPPGSGGTDTDGTDTDGAGGTGSGGTGTGEPPPSSGSGSATQETGPGTQHKKDKDKKQKDKKDKDKGK